MEEIKFSTSFQKITATQSSLSGLKDKVKCTSNYKALHTKQIPIIHFKEKNVIETALFQDILEWYHVNIIHPGKIVPTKLSPLSSSQTRWKRK
jgi:hypothetical protein